MSSLQSPPDRRPDPDPAPTQAPLLYQPFCGLTQAGGEPAPAISSGERTTQDEWRSSSSCRGGAIIGQGIGPAHRLTADERLELQCRVRAGATYAAAAVVVGYSAKSVQRLLAKTGGLKSRARPPSPLRLSLAEREEVSRGVLAGASCRHIAARLGRAPSTVSREMAGMVGGAIVRGARTTGRTDAGAVRSPTSWRSVLGSAGR